MNNKYSTPELQYLNVSKIAKIPIDLVLKKAIKLLETRVNHPDFGIELSRFLIERAILKYNRCNYFFINDEELFNTLLTSRVKTGLNNILRVMERLGVADSVTSNRYFDLEGLKLINDKSRSILFCINHKNKEYKSFIFEIVETDDKMSISIHESDNNFHSPIVNGSKIKVNKKDSNIFDWSLIAVRFVSNFILYLCAFPDKIIDGVPKDYVLNRRETVRKGKRFTVKTSEKMIGGIGIIPHIRSGHFRHLTSEYYTKKQGQTVWVSSSMVNGSAKTVTI